MTVRRLFAPALPASGGEVTLGEEATRHARVLRLGPGDPIELFDGEGARALGRIVRSAPRLVCEVGPPAATAEPTPRVHLVLGLPKSGTLDDAVRAATEAGASSIHLLVAENSVGRRGVSARGAPADKASARGDRLERVIREASRQCERDRRPELHAPADLESILGRVPTGHLKLVASAREPGPWPAASADDVWVAVGPEGGFRDDEEETFARAGFAPVSLGPYVLRAVTAAPVAVALARARASTCFS